MLSVSDHGIVDENVEQGDAQNPQKNAEAKGQKDCTKILEGENKK